MRWTFDNQLGGESMENKRWRTVNPEGKRRVVVTKELPGQRWLDILTGADCKIEICTTEDVLSIEEIKAAIGDSCDAAIGQLTEDWGADLFTALKEARATAYSNYAVGFNNIDLKAATRAGIPVGNTPGVLTETTAEMAVALTFATARRLGEGERYLRAGKFRGWLPTLFVGDLLEGKTVGIIGAGRIGSAYARMMVEGHKMNLVYFDLQENKDLENYVADYSDFHVAHGGRPLFCKKAATVESLLEESDCVSIHTVLDESTRHLINGERLQLMKENALLINTARGPVIDEKALVTHCRNHPGFGAGLDVFENEPELSPGLVDLENVVIVPHIASATLWTRSGMATIAAVNVAGILQGYPVWNKPDVLMFLEDNAPQAAPSILNAKELGLSFAP